MADVCTQTILSPYVVQCGIGGDLMPVAVNNEQVLGQQIQLTAAFTSSGSAADPTTITLKILDPSGNTDTYTYAGGTVSKSGTGGYYKNFTPDEAGTWRLYWAGTGTVVAATQGEFFIIATEVG